MIRIAICDDESKYLEWLRQITEEVGTKLFDELRVFPYQSVNALLKESNITFDLVLLDIWMDEMSGFEAAKKLRSKNPNQSILFVTSEFSMVYDSFEFGPLDFIRKRSLVEMKDDIRKALKRFRDKCLKEKKICVQTIDKKLYCLKTEDILKFESEKNYLTCYLRSGGNLSMRKTITCQEKELESLGFTRINKGVLVNLKYIDKIDRKERWVMGREIGRIDLGRKYEPVVMEQYIKYLAGK
jgi:DNA-binding LytR/AlgR family response regulator